MFNTSQQHGSFDSSFHPGLSSRVRAFTSHPDLEAALSLIDSDDTAPNLPGPGRNLGRLYDALGAQLVGFLMRRRKLKQSSVNSDDTQLVVRIGSADNTTHDEVKTTSFGTNSTRSNLPGPGRTVGLFLGWLGKKLERQMNTLVTQRGAGPQAIAEKILRLRCIHDKPFLVLSVLDRDRRDLSTDERSKRKLLRYCKKLFAYARSAVLSTQHQALDCIISLAICDTYIQSILNECLEHESFL